MRRALPLLAVLALAGCGGGHEAQPKPQTPVLSAVLAHRKSVHFVLDGTAKVELESMLARLHHVPPFHIHAVGNASRSGLSARGAVDGELAAAGTVVVAGDKAYAGAGGTWYDLGSVRSLSEPLRSAHWNVAGDTLRGTLHLSTDQLERLSGLSLPFGVEGADAAVKIRLSRWGKPVSIRTPSGAVPLPSG